jgi:hypothetical protein
MAGMKSPSRDGEGKEKTTAIYPDHQQSNENKCTDSLRSLWKKIFHLGTNIGIEYLP